ncbi:MAG: hypothetical protein GY804_00050 [Alphaproteobacteria bacterium]|nr:hypothetical protein [Alphaproteobacteria bacterium]
MLKILNITFLLLSCLVQNGEAQSASQKQLTFIDSVLDQSVATEIYWEDRKELVKQISTLDTASQKEIFTKLAKVSLKDRADAIGYLFRIKDTTAFNLLSHYKDSLYGLGWDQIAQHLRRNEWRNRQVNDSLFAYLKTSNNKAMKEGILLHFQYQAMYDDLDSLWSLRKKITEPKLIRFIYLVQCYYKTDMADKRILEIFSKPFESFYGTRALIASMGFYKRYDFLDELQQLKMDLQSTNNSLEKEVASKLIKMIDSVIPQLEKAKAERRKIGKPLDWGLDFPTKESEEEERKKKQAQEEAAAKEKKSPATGINLDWGLDK